MSETTHAVLDEHGNVTNLIVLADGSDWEAPEGHSLLDAGDTTPAIGDHWDGVAFQVALLPAAPVDLQAQIDALTEMILGGGL